MLFFEYFIDCEIILLELYNGEFSEILEETKTKEDISSEKEFIVLLAEKTNVETKSIKIIKILK